MRIPGWPYGLQTGQAGSDTPMPTLLIIIASTRPDRGGQAVADWFIPVAREHGGFDVEVADLAEIDLPLLDEPKHPRLREYTHKHTKRWSEIVDAADAFVFVHQGWIDADAVELQTGQGGEVGIAASVEPCRDQVNDLHAPTLSGA